MTARNFRFAARIRKHGARIEVDLSGTARQARGAINGTYLDAKTTVGIALKYLLDPGGPFTSGCYRPIDILIPDGAILSALPPEGVVFAYGESTNALLIAIFAALAVPLGKRAVGGDISAPESAQRRGPAARRLALGVDRRRRPARALGRHRCRGCRQLLQFLPGQRHGYAHRGARG